MCLPSGTAFSSVAFSYSIQIFYMMILWMNFISFLLVMICVNNIRYVVMLL